MKKQTLHEFLYLQERTCRLLDHTRRFPVKYVDARNGTVLEFYLCRKCNSMTQDKFLKGDFK